MDKREEAIWGKRREESRAGQGRGNIYLKTPPQPPPPLIHWWFKNFIQILKLHELNKNVTFSGIFNKDSLTVNFFLNFSTN